MLATNPPQRIRYQFTLIAALTLIASLPATAASPFGDVGFVDLADEVPEAPNFMRLHGSTGNGALGVSVAGGIDCDGDGNPDVAMASMLASVGTAERAGIVYLLLGDGTVGGIFDTAIPSHRTLQFEGSGRQETAGNELWMDDVTGDGRGDLLIGRQNYTVDSERAGVGALSIVVGSSAMRDAAAALEPIGLDAPPDGLAITTIVGTQAFGRFGIWMRTGDVDGDGIKDIVVGADQERHGDENHGGAVYVIRGGPHLATGARIDLADAATHGLVGNILRITPPNPAFEYHFGATVEIADLDGNGRGEVLIAASLNRGGATVIAAGGPPGSAHGIGGTARGTLFIAWDDHFPNRPWGPSDNFAIESVAERYTMIHGGNGNLKFGEELLGGVDFDGDGRADLFAGDIVGNIGPARDRPQSGSAHVFYDAARLKGRVIDMRTPPDDIETTVFLGAQNRDIAGDTATHGDFDGDGRADLAFSAPHAMALDRTSAGVVYVFFGQVGRWPAQIDLRDPLDVSGARVTAILGAKGGLGADSGDTLAYSAAAGDLDGDGRSDLIINEMEGNGVAPTAIDVGNLIVISGTRIAGLEPGSLCPPVARIDCGTASGRRSIWRQRTGSSSAATRLTWRWRHGAATTLAEFAGPLPFDDDYSLCLYGNSNQGMLRRELSLFDTEQATCRSSVGSRLRCTSTSARAVMSPGVHGRTSIQLGVRGIAAATATSLRPPLTVQLHRGGSSHACWSSHFEQALVETANGFSARGQ